MGMVKIFGNNVLGDGPQPNSPESFTYIDIGRKSQRDSEFSLVYCMYCCTSTLILYEFLSQGRPELRKVVDECEYYFDWHTSIVCPNRTDIFDSNSCLIHDVNRTRVMNLIDLRESRHEVSNILH